MDGARQDNIAVAAPVKAQARAWLAIISARQASIWLNVAVPLRADVKIFLFAQLATSWMRGLILILEPARAVRPAALHSRAACRYQSAFAVLDSAVMRPPEAT